MYIYPWASCASHCVSLTIYRYFLKKGVQTHFFTSSTCARALAFNKSEKIKPSRCLGWGPLGRGGGCRFDCVGTPSFFFPFFFIFFLFLFAAVLASNQPPSHACVWLEEEGANARASLDRDGKAVEDISPQLFVGFIPILIETPGNTDPGLRCKMPGIRPLPAATRAWETFGFGRDG